MHNELFSIGPFTVYTYGLMIAIGILAAYFIAEKRGQKMGLDMSKLDTLTFWILIGGFAASKILYWLTRLPDILQDPYILMDIGNGWVVYGGIIGGILAGIVYCRHEGLNFWKYFDLIIPEVALAQGFGRIGCFFAGCCYGVETHGWWGITFPQNSMAPAGVLLVPTQLLSSVYDFLMFFILVWMSRKAKFDGELGGWYLVMYSIGRFIIEFWRGDLIRGEVGILSTSQFISIFTLAAGILILLAGRNWAVKKAAQKR